jgi:F-type H+-transporting ATPase subunit delta
MAEIATIARPYAEAAFEVAAAANALPEWSTLLGALAAVATNADLREALSDPRVTPQQQVELVLAPLKLEVTEPQRNFLQVLAQNDRLGALPAIAEQFEALRAEREGVADAEVESAFPLGEGEVNTLVSVLEKRFRRRIRPRVTVAPDLIGGVRVTIGDEVIDGSVRGKLHTMELALQS